MIRARFRRLYGDSPLHLLALIACLLIAGAAIAGWFDSFPGPTTVKILEWFLAAIVAHDLVLLPLYSLLDRIAFGAIGGQRRAAPSPERVPGFVYLRVPAMLSGLLGLVFFPEILRLGDSTFFVASGFHQRVFLARYLLTCAALFALAGLAYAVSLARGRALADRSVSLPGVQDAERSGGGPEVEVAPEHHRGGHEREHEVRAQHDHRAAQPASGGESGERENPEDVPGGGPAERDDERERRHPGGREPLARSTDRPETAGQDREGDQDADDHLHGGGLAALPEREAGKLRDPDRGDQPALGEEVGEVRAERDHTGSAEHSGGEQAPGEEPPTGTSEQEHGYQHRRGGLDQRLGHKRGPGSPP